MPELPFDWNRRSIEEIAETFSGGTPPRSNPAFYGGTIPWVKSGEVNRLRVRHTEEQITEAGFENSSARWAPAGCVLVAMYGATAGKVAKLEIKAAINQAICAVLGRPSIVDNEYLVHALTHATPDLLQRTQGSGQPNLSGSLIRSLELSVPPLPEQRKIAAILSSVDDAIEKTEVVIDQLGVMKKGLLGQLLMRGMPGRHKKLRETVAGAVPAAWDVRRLEEVAEVRTGLAKNSKKASASAVELPYLRVANVQDGYLDLSEMKTIEVDATLVERYLLKPGDVLFNEGGDADKVGRGTVWRAELPQCLHQNHVFAVRPSSAILPDFLSMYGGSSRGKAYFLDAAKQTTNLASINSAQLRALPVPIPPLAEQEEIVAAARSLVERLNAESRTLAATRSLKSALLDSLLSGRIRVTTPAQEVA